MRQQDLEKYEPDPDWVLVRDLTSEKLAIWQHKDTGQKVWSSRIHRPFICYRLKEG